MLHKFWKKLHLTLAIVVSVFLLIASITGAILSFEPINKAQHSFYVDNPKEIALVDLIKTLDSTYSEVDFVEGIYDKSGFFQLSIIDQEGEMHKFYIDPRTGKKLGAVSKPNPTFEWNKQLHRSLFMGTWGRLFMGIVAALLFLIAVSGVVLVFKRQLRTVNYFGKITRDSWLSFLHIALGRWTFPLIMIIAITGTYLSLDRFGFLPKENVVAHSIDTENLADSPEVNKYQFAVFKNTRLNEVQKIQFPFTPFPEDYYQLKLQDRDIIVNQYTGKVESTQHLDKVKIWKDWIFNLHTGKGSVGWSLVLLFASLSILFFIISGFSITIKRWVSKSKNSISKEKAEIVLLVGSESGQTARFAKHVKSILVKNHFAVFVDDLNNYSAYPKMKILIVITSTHGNGEAPGNARKFVGQFLQIQQDHDFHYSIIGFGSEDYPDFCQFALDVDSIFRANSKAQELLPLHKVNKQSPSQKQEWLRNLANVFSFSLAEKDLQEDSSNLSFTVKSITNPSAETNDHFRLELIAPTDNFTSGDLLSIIPEGENEERHYSIGKVDTSTISLSIRKHLHGICSTELANLKQNDRFEARIQSNPTFHPNVDAPLYVIANGTGIAPLIGMIAENFKKRPIDLIWGMKSEAISDLYKEELETYQQLGKVDKITLVYSKDPNYRKQYVQDIMVSDQEKIVHVLQSNGQILICGSIAMRDAVLSILSGILQKHTDLSLGIVLDKEQILTDCY